MCPLAETSPASSEPHVTKLLCLPSMRTTSAGTCHRANLSKRSRFQKKARSMPARLPRGSRKAHQGSGKPLSQSSSRTARPPSHETRSSGNQFPPRLRLSLACIPNSLAATLHMRPQQCLQWEIGGNTIVFGDPLACVPLPAPGGPANKWGPDVFLRSPSRLTLIRS